MASHAITLLGQEPKKACKPLYIQYSYDDYSVVVVNAYYKNFERVTGTYLVQFNLDDAPGKEVSSNLYWLSQTPDVMDWEKGDGYYTPEKSFADFSHLRKLPSVKLKVAARYENPGTHGEA